MTEPYQALVKRSRKYNRLKLAAVSLYLIAVSGFSHYFPDASDAMKTSAVIALSILVLVEIHHGDALLQKLAQALSVNGELLKFLHEQEEFKKEKHEP